jgi:hypothetical protein
MSPRIIKKPRAEHDLIEHFAFIAMDKLAPAERFLRVADESFAQLATTPKMGRNGNPRNRIWPESGCIQCRPGSEITLSFTGLLRTASKSSPLCMVQEILDQRWMNCFGTNPENEAII